jgi:hypothetical protein
MRVMVLVKATDWSEAGPAPTAEMGPMFEAMGRFNEELAAAGVLQAGEGLKPSSTGKRVVLQGPERRVEDGPFAPADAQVAGFWIWKVRDLAEAVSWARRCPDPMPGGGVLELRPIFEAEDFGEAMSPELVKMESDFRDRLASADRL